MVSRSGRNKLLLEGVYREATLPVCQSRLGKCSIEYSCDTGIELRGILARLIVSISIDNDLLESRLKGHGRRARHSSKA